MGTRQSVSLSDRQIAALRKEAKRIDISIADLIRRIIDQWRDAKQGHDAS
jgi:predicted DNA-binding ribbon-helix-helix protein